MTWQWTYVNHPVWLTLRYNMNFLICLSLSLLLRTSQNTISRKLVNIINYLGINVRRSS